MTARKQANPIGTTTTAPGYPIWAFKDDGSPGCFLGREGHQGHAKAEANRLATHAGSLPASRARSCRVVVLDGRTGRVIHTGVDKETVAILSEEQRARKRKQRADARERQRKEEGIADDKTAQDIRATAACGA